MRVLICGGGIIGASVAYYLSRRDVDAVVVECTGLACAASGKSGGFLALDWCDGTPLEGLARRSFALHASLAEEFPDDWGYRRLDTFGGMIDARARPAEGGPGGDRPWLSGATRLGRRLGSRETTAQVIPERFTTAMMRAAQANGAELRSGRVTGLAPGADPREVAGVELEGERIAGDAVVIALGPWSILASQWLPLPAVYGLKGHSLIFRTGDDFGPEALFLETRDVTGELLSPEVMPRSDGTTWVCAISSEAALPIDPASVEPDPGAPERLEALCARLSPALTPDRIIARQACFRPIAADGLPLIGRVPGAQNAYLATGHSVWGILNAPATGEAMAELIVGGGAGTVDLSPFDPARLPAFDPARLRMEARA